MSKRKTAFQVNEQVLFNGEVQTILATNKGGKTTKPNKQGGIFTGYKSKPCTYTLSNGYNVRGSKLEKIKRGTNVQY